MIKGKGCLTQVVLQCDCWFIAYCALGSILEERCTIVLLVLSSPAKASRTHGSVFALRSREYYAILRDIWILDRMRAKENSQSVDTKRNLRRPKQPLNTYPMHLTRQVTDIVTQISTNTRHALVTLLEYLLPFTH